MQLSLDAWLPASLIGESAETRRRARLIFYAVGIAITVDAVTALTMPAVAWAAHRASWAAVHVAMHLPTLLVLRATRSVAKAANYFIAVVFLQSTFQLEASNGFSAFGLIAVPVAAAHLVGLRSVVAWTVAASAAALVAPLAIGANAHIFGLGIAVGTITGAIGAASAIVESSRARSARAASAAEASTRLQRERLRAFAEQTFPVIAEVVNGELTFVGDHVSELLGFTPEEVIDLNVAVVRPEDVASLAARVAAEPPARTRFEIRVQHRDGRWIWLEVFAIPFGVSASDARWLFAARDIEKEVHERERLERAQRLDGIGSLAAGIAHDFNNLLMVISGFGAQLPPSEARDQVLSAAASASELTAQLLAFGRSGPSAEELIDPERELGALAPLIRSLLGEELRFELRGSAKGATARIAVGRLKQVVLNLVKNARDATPRGGLVALELRRVSISGESARELDLASGDYVEIAVHDTGHGMSDEVRRRAFDPFFSTKEPERGSGLGLASAYGIARRAQGTLTLESALGGGSTARLLLPDAMEPVPVRAAANVRDEGAASANARVWIVEDDERIRKLIESALTAAGHRTRAFPSAAAALASSGGDGPPDLLVTDVVMPGLRGTELAARMRAASPRLRVLYLSGYSEVEVGDWRSGEVGVQFLAKPVRPSEVVGAVSSLLAE